MLLTFGREGTDYSGLIELETLILDNTIHYRGDRKQKTSVRGLYK
jgi:hypothetical protein